MTLDDGTLNVEYVVYKTLVESKKVGYDPEKLKLSLSEKVVNCKYDFIIVDAPLGHQPLTI